MITIPGEAVIEAINTAPSLEYIAQHTPSAMPTNSHASGQYAPSHNQAASTTQSQADPLAMLDAYAQDLQQAPQLSAIDFRKQTLDAVNACCGGACLTDNKVYERKHGSGEQVSLTVHSSIISGQQLESALEYNIQRDETTEPAAGQVTNEQALKYEDNSVQASPVAGDTSRQEMAYEASVSSSHREQNIEHTIAYTAEYASLLPQETLSSTDQHALRYDQKLDGEHTVQQSVQREDTINPTIYVGEKSNYVPITLLGDISSGISLASFVYVEKYSDRKNDNSPEGISVQSPLFHDEQYQLQRVLVTSSEQTAPEVQPSLTYILHDLVSPDSGGTSVRHVATTPVRDESVSAYAPIHSEMPILSAPAFVFESIVTQYTQEQINTPLYASIPFSKEQPSQSVPSHDSSQAVSHTAERYILSLLPRENARDNFPTVELSVTMNSVAYVTSAHTPQSILEPRAFHEHSITTSVQQEHYQPVNVSGPNGNEMYIVGINGHDDYLLLHPSQHPTLRYAPLEYAIRESAALQGAPSSVTRDKNSTDDPSDHLYEHHYVHGERVVHSLYVSAVTDEVAMLKQRDHTSKSVRVVSPKSKRTSPLAKPNPTVKKKERAIRTQRIQDNGTRRIKNEIILAEHNTTSRKQARSHGCRSLTGSQRSKQFRRAA